MSLSRKAKLLMEKMEIQAKFPYLIEITNYPQSGQSEKLRYANTDEDVLFTEIVNGEEVTNTFQAGFFKVTLPEQTTSGFTNATLTISNIDQSWIAKIRSTYKRAKIRFLATIEHYEEGTVVEPIEDMEFALTNATANETTIQWTMLFDDLSDIKVPYDICNDRICPALV